MKSKIKCPLCKSTDVQVMEKIQTHQITDLWVRIFQMDVSYIFKNIPELEYIHCPKCSLKFFNPEIPGDDKFYSNLARLDWYYLHEGKSEYDFATKYISEKMNVLDIGSGRGVFSKYITGKYTGLELNSQAVETAKKDKINVIHQTVEDFAKKTKEQFDVICTFQVMEHLLEIDSFMKAVSSLIKKDGKFIIAVPNNDSFLKHLENNILNIPPHHSLQWNEQSLRYLAQMHGYSVEEVYFEKVSAVHALMFYKGQIGYFIKQIFSRRVKPVNMNFWSVNMFRALSLAGRFLRLTNIHSGFPGHTVIIVLKKESVKK